MAKPTTIKDIAQHVGVGNTAVSAVLSRIPSRHVRVSVATRARILEVARQMQYRPNGVARSLRYQKTDVIGVYMQPGYLSPEAVFSSQIIGACIAAVTRMTKTFCCTAFIRADQWKRFMPNSPMAALTA